MMKLYKIVILFLLIPVISFASEKNKKHKKSKTIHKVFSVNSDASLVINNKYGNIHVTTWNENRIDITVKVTIKGDNLDRVITKLKTINIEFEGSKNLVEATTIIKKSKSNWSWFNNSNNVNYKINYFVKMPITNNVGLNNKYGNIELDRLNGKANINCDYGKIDIESLMNETNSINLDYCSNSQINNIKSGNINMDYSKLKIENATNLKINTDYSNTHILKASNVNFNSDYGSITIDEANKVIGNSDYAGIRIGTLKKNVKIETEYGSLRIKNIEEGFESVDINGSYAGIKIGTSNTNNFNFIIDLNYAGFSYPNEKTEIYKNIKKTTSKYYEGSFGNEKSSSIVKIKSSYGGVSIKLND